MKIHLTTLAVLVSTLSLWLSKASFWPRFLSSAALAVCVATEVGWEIRRRQER